MSRDLVPRMRERLKEYEDLVLGNEIFAARTKGIGVLPADVACSYGVSGALLQAAGVPEDSRKTEPYLFYDQVEFDVPTGPQRRLLRPLRHPAGPDPRVAADHRAGQRADPARAGQRQAAQGGQAPPGHAYVRTEAPLGQLSYYMVSHGEKTPWRFKMRTPSFNNISSLPYLLKGTLVPDMIAVMGSMFFIVGDIDR
jgi:NADH-quinone oxidoreductase subunit D